MDGSGSNTLKMWILAGGLSFVVGVLMLVVQAVGSGNIDYDRDDRALFCVHQDQCERPVDRKPIAEVQNTWSNLAYLLFGVCVLVRALREGVSLRDRLGPLGFGAGLCFLAVCSGYYHGTLNFAGTRDAAGQLRAFVENGALQCRPSESSTPQLLDMVGVYAVLLALVMFGVECALRKKASEIGFWQWVAAAIAGGIALGALILVFIVMSSEQAVGGKLAGVVLLAFLVMLGGATAVRVRFGDSSILQVAVWLVTLPLWLLLSYEIKANMHWDSTAVFVALSFVLAGLVAVNWALSSERLHGPELVVLGVVFILGVVPRLFDGYESHGEQVLRHDLCSPDGPLQPHAVWHLMSAFALALSFDMMEKSSPSAATRGTVLLPSDRWLSDALETAIGRQPLSAILLKVVLSTASLLLLIMTIVFYGTGWPAVAASALACVLCLLLWLWPLWSA